jgi:hypothetical protein
MCKLGGKPTLPASSPPQELIDTLARAVLREDAFVHAYQMLALLRAKVRGLGH